MALMVRGAGTDDHSLAWILLSFAAMYRFKIGMISWIGISALAGLIWSVVVPLVR